MLGLKSQLLLGTAAATALFHTLIPDHWLPFVLIGKARGWTGRTTALVSGLSALIHTGLSVGLALLALEIGALWAGTIGQTLTRSSALLLVVFGVVYALWAWRKSGHFHPGGRLLHSADERRACAGGEGHDHPGHLHYHADGELIHGAVRRSGWFLAVIVGLNPCVLLLPIMIATLERGTAAVAVVTLVYALVTTVLTVGLSVAGTVGTRRIALPGAARHAESASGILVALTGVVFLLLEA